MNKIQIRYFYYGNAIGQRLHFPQEMLQSRYEHGLAGLRIVSRLWENPLTFQWVIFISPLLNPWNVAKGVRPP